MPQNFHSWRGTTAGDSRILRVFLLGYGSGDDLATMVILAETNAMPRLVRVKRYTVEAHVRKPPKGRRKKSRSPKKKKP